MSYKAVCIPDKNTMNFYNVSEGEVKLDCAPIKYDVDEIENPNFYQELGLSVLTLINDGEEFVYRFVPEDQSPLGDKKEVNIIGSSHGDLYPDVKEFSYNIFRRVLKTKKPEKILTNFYEKEIKVFALTINVLYNDGDICTKDEMNSEDLASNDEFSRILIANNYVQEATKTAIHFHDNRGVYHWTPEVYNLIEREPREDDATYHILLDLMDEKDQKEINTTMDNLNPDEFLGTQIHKITLESGKTKIVKINSHNLYDKSGVFLQRNSYTQDITEEYYKQNELTVLNETFKDVQKAA